MRSRVLFAVATVALLAGCSGPASVNHPSTLPPVTPEISAAASQTASPIKHVVIIIQENRSFENLFAGFPNADAPMTGASSSHGTVSLHEIKFIDNRDLNHDFAPALIAWNGGKMNGFDKESFDGDTQAGTYPYAYVDRGETKPYWTLAQQYVLADHMFPTEFGPSFTAHLSLISGNTTIDPGVAEANYPFASPWGCGAGRTTRTTTVDTQRVLSFNGPYPCFTQFRTIADRLDAAHVSWRYYAPEEDDGGDLWSIFQAIKNVRYGKDWQRNIVSPETNIFADAATNKLAHVSYVIPDWRWSDHPGALTNQGPSWVGDVVNAIGSSKEWKSTAIVVLWDDWGGWYDNVAPPNIGDFRGPGIRVPCIVISPYAKAGYVDHRIYEFGSVLRLIEETFGLPALGTTAQGYTDGSSASMKDAFDFRQQPRPFTPVKTFYPASFFIEASPSLRPPDDD